AVVSPAVEPLRTVAVRSFRAGVIHTRSHARELDTSRRRHRFRHIGVAAAGTELSVVVVAPAVEPRVRAFRAGVNTTRGHARERHVLGRFHRIRYRAERILTVPELAVGAVPPAVHAAVRSHRTGVAVPRAHARELHASREPAHFHRHRRRTVALRTVAELATGTVAPAVDVL